MNPNFTHQLKTVGIGEILWDRFPDSQRLGGAPANFAYHCGQLGATSFPVSCIGDDQLGSAAAKMITERGSSTEYLDRLSGCITGQVNITLDSDRKPTFDILKDTAWDRLQFSPKLKNLAEQLDAVCFGTLAQRSPATRETIQSFVRCMPQQSLKIFDVNLRAPFYTKEVIEESLDLASVLKLSDDELIVLAELFNLQGSIQEQLSTLLNQFNLKLIAFTRGSKGSILMDRHQCDECPAPSIDVVDSVGAGDSFTAALCIGLLQQWSLYEVNALANRVAAFVCSKFGATPILPPFISAVKVN